MRLALVHPYSWPRVRRGAERYLDDLAHYLAGQGHSVNVVTGTHGEVSIEKRDDGVTVYRLTHLKPGPLCKVGLSEIETFGVRTASVLRRARPDVVHAFTPSGAIAGRAAGRPTLYTVLGHPNAAQLPTKRVPRWLLGSAVRLSNAVAVLSRASATALRSTFGRGAIVLPPGVRMERFVPNLEPRTGPPRLLFSATLTDRRKRADLAISTLARLLERHPDARLVLSGEGDPAWVTEEARRFGDKVSASIDVLGPGEPDEVPGRYRDATLTILPAEHEAFGLSVVESLASGTPVVCSPGGGMSEIVGSAPVGSTAATATPGSMADAVEMTLKLAQDGATPARCVERARLWSWDETVGPQHEECYRSLLARRQPELEAIS